MPDDELEWGDLAKYPKLMELAQRVSQLEAQAHQHDRVVRPNAATPQALQFAKDVKKAIGVPAAFLMLAIDTRCAVPTVKAVRITSDDNPEVRHGLRWAQVAGVQGIGDDYAQGQQDIISRVENDATLNWITSLPGWSEAAKDD